MRPTKRQSVIQKENLAKNIGNAVTKNIDVAKTKNIDNAVTKNIDVAKTKNIDVAKTKNIDVVMPKNIDDAMPKNIDDAMPKNIDDAMPKSIDDAMPKNIDDAMPKSIDDAMPNNIDDAMPKNLVGTKTKNIFGAKTKHVACATSNDTILKEINISNQGGPTSLLSAGGPTLHKYLLRKRKRAQEKLLEVGKEKSSKRLHAADGEVRKVIASCKKEEVSSPVLSCSHAQLANPSVPTCRKAEVSTTIPSPSCIQEERVSSPVPSCSNEEERYEDLDEDGKEERYEDFDEEILERFRKADGEVAKLCCENSLILYFGKRLFEKISTHPQTMANEKVKVIMNMIILARILIVFKEKGVVMDQSLEVEDMFDGGNFKMLEQCVPMVAKIDGEVNHAHNLFIKSVLTNFTITILRMYIINKDLSNMNKVEDFQFLLNHFSYRTFGKSRADINNKIFHMIKKPTNFPLEDVAKIINYINDNLKKFAEKGKNLSIRDFTALRSLCVAHLTLLNPDRSVEPAKLLIKEVSGAMMKGWSYTDNIEDIENENEKILKKTLKVIYRAGGISGQLHCLVVPEEIVSAMHKLCDPEVRLRANVSPSNNYVFPLTDKSEAHASELSEVGNVCILAGVPKELNAHKERHRAATWFIDEAENLVFHEHLGLAKQFDFNVYSTPKVEAILSTYASSLMDMFPCKTTFADINPHQKAKDYAVKKFLERYLPQEKEKPIRFRMSWDLSEVKEIIKYFSKYIEDITQEGLKGSLPGMQEIDKFLELHPEVLAGNEYYPEQPHNKKRKMVKNKVLTERTKYRNKVALQPFTSSLRYLKS